jgi:hypothetical protein
MSLLQSLMDHFAGKKRDAMMAFGQVKYLGAMWMSSVARKNPDLKVITVSPGQHEGNRCLESSPIAAEAIHSLRYVSGNNAVNGNCA